MPLGHTGMQITSVGFGGGVLGGGDRGAGWSSHEDTANVVLPSWDG